jgi:Na+/proline symporter
VNLLLLGVLGYVVLQVAIGFAVSRRVRTEDDYLLAGRRLGYPLATFSIFATWFGAETCIGAAGAVYESGLAGARADPFGYTACILLAGILLAIPLWRAGITTLGDLFRQRYSPGVERFAVLLMVPTSILWAAAQIRAFGQVLASTSDAISVAAGIGLAAVAVLVYTTAGGLLADAWTDLIQGLVLAAGLVGLFTLAMVHLGGPAAAFSLVEPARLALTAPDEPLLETANRWAIPVLGSLTAQELVSRLLACRSPHVARRSSLAAAGGYVLVGAIPVALGLLAPHLGLTFEDAEHVLPTIARSHLNGAFYVVFVGALVSAILSTVDSCLLVAGSLVSHNLVAPCVPGLGDRGRLAAARIAVVGAGLTAWGLALGSRSVLGLVEEASGFGSAGILVLVFFGLLGRFGGAASAASALAAGVTVWVLAHFVYALPGDYLASVGAALVAYVGAALLERAFERGRGRSAHAVSSRKIGRGVLDAAGGDPPQATAG